MTANQRSKTLGTLRSMQSSPNTCRVHYSLSYLGKFATHYSAESVGNFARLLASLDEQGNQLGIEKLRYWQSKIGRYPFRPYAYLF